MTDFTTMEEKQQNAVRTALRSEITWLISFIICLMGFVTTVIMPLQKVQIQLAQIQTDLVISRESQISMLGRIGRLELSHAKFEQLLIDK